MAMGIGKRIVLSTLIVGVVKLTALAGGLYVYGSNRPEPPGTFHYGSAAYDFVSDCFEMIGSSREKAGHGQFAFCQCYATELQRREIEERDFPMLLQTIKGERPGTLASEKAQATRPSQIDLPPHLRDLVDTTLPQCRAKAVRFAEAERRMDEKRASAEAHLQELRETHRE